MVDDYDAQVRLWRVETPPIDNRIPLRTSSSSLSPVPSPMRTYSPADDNGRAELCDSGMHIVRCDNYAQDPYLQPPAPRLVGVEPLLAQLTAVVGRTLANPALVPCEQPVIAVECPPGSGARSAVHLWASMGVPRRVAVLTYSFSNPERELTLAFHLRLMALAASISPCILIVHRPLLRANALADHLFVSMWTAWLQTREHQRKQLGVAPPFWLLFIDRVPISMAAPAQWGWIPHVATMPGYMQGRLADYIRCHLERALRERLASDDDAARYTAAYTSTVGPFAQAHSTDFASIADVIKFVALLFDLPLRDISIPDLAAMAIDGAPPTVLPSPDHFAAALVEMRQQRLVNTEHLEAEQRAAHHANQMRRTGLAIPGHPMR